MSSDSDDIVDDQVLDKRIRNLVRHHYFRNKHLTPVHDADDLFQDAWIYFHSSNGSLSNKASDDSKDCQLSQEFILQKAVRTAASRAFDKLRKRRSRGSATETRLEFEPAECIPDVSVVIDLQQLIESLPECERYVIEMLRCGFDGTEISDLLGVTPQTVSRRKHKAISRLRRMLEVRDAEVSADA